MNYYQTWFGKNSPIIYSGGKYCSRQYWLHQTVEVFTGNLCPMHHKNPDGSIDVLGAEIYTFYGHAIGTHHRESLQESLAIYSERIASLGAKIVKQTKNTLRATYKNERLLLEIRPTSTPSRRT